MFSHCFRQNNTNPSINGLGKFLRQHLLLIFSLLWHNSIKFEYKQFNNGEVTPGLTTHNLRLTTYDLRLKVAQFY